MKKNINVEETIKYYDLTPEEKLSALFGVLVENLESEELAEAITLIIYRYVTIIEFLKKW